MPLVNTVLLFLRWFRQPRGSVREPEPADMGTAFGMECWLEAAESVAANARTGERPDAATASAAQASTAGLPLAAPAAAQGAAPR